MNREVSIALAIAACLSGAAPAISQEFPTRPIRLILGPSPEATPRLVAEYLGRELGQPVVVEPRLGAGGELAAKAVATSEPDGYTLLYASSNYTLATAMKLGSFDFGKDFEPVALVGTSAYVLVTNTEVPAATAGELVALAKAKPGELNCGSSGMATPGHLSCEMFRSLASVNIVHVPFRSADQAMNALISKQVQFSITVSTAARGQIESGMIRGVAVTTEAPSPLVPGPPTLQSTLPGFVVHGWGSIVAPKGTPRPVVEKLNAAVMRALADPPIAERLRNFGLQPAELHGPDEFADFIANEIGRWNKTIDATGVERGKAR